MNFVSFRVVNYVKPIRLLRGLTQTELARACRISKNALSSIELGYGCTISTALRLAFVLDVSVDELFALCDASPEEVSV